jgi:hypothetical protein
MPGQFDAATAGTFQSTMAPGMLAARARTTSGAQMGSGGAAAISVDLASQRDWAGSLDMMGAVTEAASSGKSGGGRMPPPPPRRSIQ